MTKATDTKAPQTLDAFARSTDEAKRDQVIKVRPDVLMIQEGFNVRGVGMSADEYWNQEKVIQHIENLCLAYTNGEYVPPIVVKFDAEKQKAVVKDGHHRYKALMLAIERGAPIQYVKVEQIQGDESNQQLLMLKSSNSLELTPVEKAEIIHRLSTYGFEPEQIATKIGKSITYVSYMLKVYNLPLETKRLIQQGKLTVNSALEPKERKLLNKDRKANRKVINKVIDELLVSKSVEVNTEANTVKIEIPLELWEKFKVAQAENKGATAEDEAEKAFLENQGTLPLDDETENKEHVA